jgi:hypothetical protein
MLRNIKYKKKVKNDQKLPRTAEILQVYESMYIKKRVG